MKNTGSSDLQVEIRSNNNLVCQSKQMGNSLMGATLHFGPDSAHNTWRPTHFEA